MKKCTQDDEKSQIERFMKTAHQLGCGEDETTFKAKLGVIARQKPKKETQKLKKGLSRES
jgi:hypothetical protein